MGGNDEGEYLNACGEAIVQLLGGPGAALRAPITVHATSCIHEMALRAMQEVLRHVEDVDMRRAEIKAGLARCVGVAMPQRAVDAVGDDLPLEWLKEFPEHDSIAAIASFSQFERERRRRVSARVVDPEMRALSIKRGRALAMTLDGALRTDDLPFTAEDLLHEAREQAKVHERAPTTRHRVAALERRIKMLSRAGSMDVVMDQILLGTARESVNDLVIDGPVAFAECAKTLESDTEIA